MKRSTVIGLFSLAGALCGAVLVFLGILVLSNFVIRIVEHHWYEAPVGFLVVVVGWFTLDFLGEYTHYLRTGEDRRAANPSKVRAENIKGEGKNET
jgi:putative copper export protein